MRVHDSLAYRKMNATRMRISQFLELTEVLLVVVFFKNGFNLVNTAVSSAILDSISGLEPS